MSDCLRPHGILQARILEWVALPFPRESSTQGSNPDLPHARRILYQLSHKGNPRILEVGSLSLLQQIFPTQELNQGLLHCRQILYQLSHQGRPRKPHSVIQSKFKVLRTRGATDVNPNPRAGEEKRVQLNGETERKKGVSLLSPCLLYSSHPQQFA